jgi:hypothetical protein
VVGGTIAVIKTEKNRTLRNDCWFWRCLLIGVLLLFFAFMVDALKALSAEALTLSGLKPSLFNWPV